MSDHSRPSSSRRRRRAAVSAACVAGLGLASVVVGGVASNVGAAPGDKVQILSFNDYHGHVEPGTPGSIDGSFGGPAAGGAEFLSAKLTELRDAGATDGVTESFTVAAGDLIGGSPFFSGLFHDEPSVETLNAMGLDVSGVGNHEFDEGIDELLRMQNGGCFDLDGDMAPVGTDDADDCYFPAEPYPGASFQWLSANVTEDGVTDVGTGRPETPLPEYELKDVNGTQVAFIGMTLEGTDALVSAAGVAGYSFQDEVDTANALIADIKADGAEAIFVLLHEGGIPNPFSINGCVGISGPIIDINAGLDAEIDGIITGHTHQPYTCSLPDPDGADRPVTSAWSFGRVVTEITFDLDAMGDVDRSTVTIVNHPVLQDELTADPAQTAILDKWAPLAEDLGNDPVGEIAETITRGGTPTGSDRGVESAAGNLVADAQLAATAEAPLMSEVAFMNPGGLRSDLVFEESDAMEGDGVVTFGEAFTFQPFNNTLFVLPMTGAQIISVLEEQCQPGDSSRPVLHLGVSDGFTYDLAITTQGGVCTAVEVSNVKLGGVDLDPAAMYKVTVNEFLADGGDNFSTFAEVDKLDRAPGPQDIDALNDYLGDAIAPVPAPGTDRVNETPTVLPGPTTSLTPARLLETRVGDDKKTVDGEFEGDGPNLAGGTIELVVADRGGVASDASAVLLNVAVIRPETNGFLTVYPCGTERPLAANANYPANGVVSNAVLAKVGDEGKVCIYTSAMADLTADVIGSVPAGGSPSPVDPARLLETRTGPDAKTVDGEFEGEGPIEAGETLKLDVAERGGVDADAKAVMMNVAAINPATNGFLTIFACDVDQPNAASVNYTAGTVKSNSVTSGIGVDGDVCIYASQTVEVAVDVNGFVPADGSPDPLEPARILETRTGADNKTVDGEFEGDGPIPAMTTLELDVAGRGGVDADAATAVLNVAAILPEAPGFATVYPCGEDQPNAASLNYAAGAVTSNAVTAKIGDEGKVCIYVSSTTEMAVDVTAAIPPIVPANPAE